MIMKHIIFLLSCLLIFSAKSYSQVDKKYLTGAVPEVNGKVIFSETFDLQGISKAQIYDRALNWTNTNFNTTDNRIAYTDKEKAIISCRGLTELMFSSGALSLDKAFMTFQLNLFCENNSCKAEIRSISYSYPVSNKKEPEKYSAEEWITDKEAVNKDKLYKSNGKFRIKTIDFKDKLYNTLYSTLSTGKMSYLYEVEIKNGPEISYKPVQNTSDVVETKPTPQSPSSALQSTAGLSSYKKLDPEKIPGNIIKMLSNDWMLITAGNDSGFNMMTASWGGLGYLWEKPVAFCFINPARYTYQLMETNNYYTLSFYTEAYRDALKYCGSTSGKNSNKVEGSGLTPITLPSGAKAFSEAWLIIECKKVLGQQITKDAVFDEKVKENWTSEGKQLHKMYAGEIVNVWVK